MKRVEFETCKTIRDLSRVSFKIVIRYSKNGKKNFISR